MEPLTGPVAPAPPESPKAQIERKKKIEAVRGFEEMFLNEMMKSMRKTVPESEEGGQAKALWRERFDAEIAHQVAESGGIGLAKLLEPRLGPPGRTK
jgi:flagellar protein FlgJ